MTTHYNQASGCLDSENGCVVSCSLATHAIILIFIFFRCIAQFDAILNIVKFHCSLQSVVTMNDTMHQSQDKVMQSKILVSSPCHAPIPLSHHTHSGAHKLCYSSRNVLYFEHCCSSCAIIYWVWYTVKISCTTKENIQTTQIILRIVWKEWNVQEEKQSNEDEASDPICAECNNVNTNDNDTQT